MSSDNMYTDGRYLANNPDWDVQDAPWKAEVIASLLRKNNVTPHEVVETGCGAGAVLENLGRLLPGIASLRGYDISPQAIALAQKRETERLRFFREDITITPSPHADLMLVIDVVEHVDDIYGFMRSVKPRSDFFVLHIPLDLCCRTLLKPHVLLQQREAVGHIHYFSREMVLWLLRDTGYEIIDWCYTKPAIDTQPAGSLKQVIKKALRAFSFSISKNGSASLWGGYSMMILAK